MPITNQIPMTRNLFSDFPSPDDLVGIVSGTSVPSYREANAHIHTPYSFSAFENIGTIFTMAKEEGLAVLGINDFFVTDGYDVFSSECRRHSVFPLFNIELIGLLKNEQRSGIRVNDPHNPGRIYFCGKGLDYPFKLGWLDRSRLDKVRRESQKQARMMIDRLNSLIHHRDPALALSYGDIKKKYTQGLVRERHIARAVRLLAVENFSSPDEQMRFIESLYGRTKSRTSPSFPAALENEIRANLLKAGGAAFVEEDEGSFLEIGKIIKIITHAGGIPCYPVLLDDTAGRFTEFERDPEKLWSSLVALGIGCIELMPGRNDPGLLGDFVDLFNEKGFVITFGTEHNTPELTPLTVTSRGSQPLDDKLKTIAWEGVCVIAAHQYLRARRRPGFVADHGRNGSTRKQGLAKLGRAVIEYFLKRSTYEPADQRTD